MSSDSHQGGRLEDMAASGTKIPGDAGKQNLIPSVPRPDQANPPDDLSHTNPAQAADNAFDIPRGVKDQGVTGEVLTGTGDGLSGNIEKKNMDDANLDPKSKGHAQYYKHARQQDEFSTKANAGHGVEPAPGEEDVSQEDLLDRRGAQ